jgi:hypothetical protein
VARRKNILKGERPVSQSTDTRECCPKFESTPWHDKVLTWENKRFIKDRVRTFFFMPLNFGSVMKRVVKTLQDTGTSMPEALCLSDHTSRWNMDVYLGVDKEVKGAENTTLSGTFYSRVYEGNFKETASWCRDFEAQAKTRGFAVKKWYMWYTTCPKCAKKYGKNYVVIIGQV